MYSTSSPMNAVWFCKKDNSHSSMNWYLYYWYVREPLRRNNHESLAPPCQCTVDWTSVIAASLQPGSRRDMSATLTSTNFIKALASPANPHITPGKQSLPSFQHVAQHPLNSDKLLSSPTEFHCCILLSPLQPINVCCWTLWRGGTGGLLEYS